MEKFDLNRSKINKNKMNSRKLMGGADKNRLYLDHIPKIYFAGPVTGNHWRGEMLSNARIMSEGYSFLNDFYYWGPFAVSDDHGCYHDVDQGSLHGMGPVAGCSGIFKKNTPDTDFLFNEYEEISSNYMEHYHNQSSTVERCLMQIDSCSMVIGYIDSLDSYGTFAELGYAAAMGKPIYLFINQEIGSEVYGDDDSGYRVRDDLWFIKKLPNVNAVICDEPYDVNRVLNDPVSQVYFISTENGDAVKIGLSQNVDKRLKALQTGNHEKLKILFSIPGNSAVESNLHELFDDYRINGEWFKIRGILEDFISIHTNGSWVRRNRLMKNPGELEMSLSAFFG